MSHLLCLGDEDVPRRDRHAAVAAAQARREKSFGGDEDGDARPGVRHSRDSGGDDTYKRVQDARRTSAQDKKSKYSIQKRGYVADEEAVR